MDWHLDITIESPFEDVISENSLRHVTENVLGHEGVEHPVELSLLITGDETVHELNRNYRQLDETTDVLAFAFQEDSDFPSPVDGITQLGEVIISAEQAERQAAENEHSLEQEIAILTIHGILHLLGYDHQNNKAEQAMRAREKEILDRLSRA